MPAGQFPFEKGNRKTFKRYKKGKPLGAFPFYISQKFFGSFFQERTAPAA